MPVWLVPFAQTVIPPAPTDWLNLLLGPFALTVGVLIFAALLAVGRLIPGATADKWEKLATAAMAQAAENNATAKAANETAARQVAVNDEMRKVVSDLVTELRLEREFRRQHEGK